ncbi:YfjI family protein, partial [Sansalvadorimonas sp. 2012CJ34-2]
GWRMARNDLTNKNGIRWRMFLESGGECYRNTHGVYPDSAPEPKDHKPDEQARDAVFALFEKLASLPVCEPDSVPVLRFSTSAQELFNEWYKKLLQRLNSTEKDTPMESHLAKYPSLLASLALIFHVVEKGLQGEVGAESLNMAIHFCELLESHARRIYGLVGEGFEGAKSLAKRLKDLPDPFQTRDFSNKGWSGLGSTEERQVALDVLCERGYIHKEVQQTATKPKALYHVNPYVLTE